ncbi:MAG TPA: GGDEF domain-containing protein [Anaerovoracaceae bacterium]|nr:GGDEF domain-containing protein [Anaerovoracaceae bacterium]
MNFRRNLPLTMVIADVNGLKLTNDAFGHFAGDDLLKKFTSILDTELRAEDVAARIGGDEFVLLLPKLDSDGAERLVNQIKARIRNVKSDNSRGNPQQVKKAERDGMAGNQKASGGWI